MLKGSEKQIKYAEDIIADIEKTFKEVWDMTKDMFESDEIKDKQEKLLEIKIQEVKSIGTAKEIIDNYSHLLRIKDKTDKYEAYSHIFKARAFTKAYREIATVGGNPDIKLFPERK